MIINHIVLRAFFDALNLLGTIDTSCDSTGEALTKRRFLTFIRPHIIYHFIEIKLSFQDGVIAILEGFFIICRSYKVLLLRSSLSFGMSKMAKNTLNLNSLK